MRTFSPSSPLEIAIEALAKAVKSKKVATLLGVLPTLIAVRSSLPSLIKSALNKALEELADFQVAIADVDLHFWRGKVVLKNISVQSRARTNRDQSGKIKIDVTVATANIFLSWSELFSGAVVADLVLDSPVVRLLWPRGDLSAHRARPHRRATDIPWQQTVQDLLPIKLNRVACRSGELSIEGLPNQNGKRISCRGIYGLARNVTNNQKLVSTLKATVDLEGEVLSGGWLQCHAEGFPLSTVPTFDSDLAIQGVDLREVSFLFHEFMGMRIDSGAMSVYAEAAAAQGRYKGYIKPVIDQMRVEKVGKGFVGTARAVAFKLTTKLLRNRQKGRIATRVGFSGDFAYPSFDWMSAIPNLLRNSFLEALRPRLEHSIFFSREGKTAEKTEIEIAVHEPTRLARALDLLKEAIKRWSDDNVARMSASLSYYTVFSLAPLLILSIAIVGLVFGHRAAEGDIVRQISSLVGDEGAQAVHTMIQAAQKPSAGIIATLVGVVTLLLGASSVMSELKDSLNKIWRVDSVTGITAVIKGKLLSYAMVLAIGFLLLVSLIASAALAAAGKFLGNVLPIPELGLQAVYFVVSFAVITVLFALIYRYLPDAKIVWRDLWLGSSVTSALFSFGKLIIGLYLGKASVTSSYGAAGSVLVILLWVYYSAMIVYFGAEFTKVYTERYGSESELTASVAGGRTA